MPRTLQADVHSQSFLAGAFIGVVPASCFATLAYPKQLLLMFDALALDLGGAEFLDRKILEQAKAEMAWLSQHGLLTTLGGLAAAARGSRPQSDRVQVVGGDWLSPLLGSSDTAAIGTFARHLRLAFQGLRETALDLRHRYGVDAIAVPDTPLSGADDVSNRDTVVRIVLNEFPLPSDATPWEAITEFRDDEEARSQFSRLKAWINKAGSGSLKTYEVADQLQELLNSYEESMRLHRTVANKGILEIFVVTTAEVAEGLAKVRWSEAAKAVFKVKHERLQLLGEERLAPGREIAYVVSARRKFGR